MKENLDNSQGFEGRKISTGQSWEITYWCEQLGCSKSELETAVNRVGRSLNAVKNYLKNK